MKVVLTLLAAALIAAGCGDDDDAPSSPAESPASDSITVGAFIEELQPDKQQILRAIVADTAACEGVKVDPGFVLLITAEALDADQAAPVAPFVEDQC